MATDTSDRKKKPFLVFALIFGIPLIPVVILYQLYADKPIVDPTETALGLDVRAALLELPKPSGDPVRIRFDLAPGKRWEMGAKYTSPDAGRMNLPEGAKPDDDFATELRRRGGRWTFAVLSRDLGRHRIRMTAAEGTDTRWLDDGATFILDPDGTMTWEGETPSPLIRRVTDPDREVGKDHTVREVIMLATGIAFPGPFAATARTWEIVSPPPRVPSFKGVGFLDRFSMKVSPVDTFPAQGGLHFAGAGEDGRWRFEWLAYRRRPIVGDPWTGRMELVYRGRLLAPPGAPHLAEGSWSVREAFHMKRDEATTAESDHLVVVEQTARPLED